jgi:hypothetical protein
VLALWATNSDLLRFSSSGQKTLSIDAVTGMSHGMTIFRDIGGSENRRNQDSMQGGEQAQRPRVVRALAIVDRGLDMQVETCLSLGK